jgi:hypothetical protein
MTGEGSLAARFAGVVGGLDAGDSVLDRFCEAGQLMLDADGAAITVNYNRMSRHTISSTSPLAVMIEDAQDVAGEGPGFDAVRSRTVVSGSFGGLEPTRWPMLENSVAELGFTGSILALPILTTDQPLGVLVAHRLVTSLSFDDRVARFLCVSMGAALVEQLTPEVIEEELTDDWSLRAVVHQATGMVTSQLHIRPEDAMVILRAHAYSDGASLIDVASRVVERDLTFNDHSSEGS